MKTRMNESAILDRREFLTATSVAGLGWLLLPRAVSAAEFSVPTTNPVGHLKLPWTDEFQ